MWSIENNYYIFWMKTFFKLIIGVVFGFIFMIVVLMMLSYSSIPGNIQIFTVLSGSMEPSIKTGALIFIKPVDTYGVGDVVTRRTDEKDVTITHRIIGQSEESGIVSFQTQGDANNVADEEVVTSDMIIGKVIFDIPYLGYLVHFARTTQGLILMIIIPASIIIYEELRKIKKEFKSMSMNREREKKQKQANLMTEELCAQFVEPTIAKSHHKPKKIIKIV